MMLYKRYVCPYLEFLVPAWSPWTRADIDRIEAVQKKAVGMVSGLAATNYEEKCDEMGLQTLFERRIDQDMAQVYRFKEGTGGIVQDMFEKYDPRPGVVTRAASGQANFKIPTARCEIRRNSFAVRTVSKWNALPESLKMSRTCDQFKKSLKTSEQTVGGHKTDKRARKADVGQPRERLDPSTKPLPWGRRSLVINVNKVRSLREVRRK
jgi:hypothetical protein